MARGRRSARSRCVTDASARPLPSVHQVSSDRPAIAAGSRSSAPAQARRNPASGRPSAAASPSATGRSTGSSPGCGKVCREDQPDLVPGVLFVGVPDGRKPSPVPKAWPSNRSRSRAPPAAAGSSRTPMTSSWSRWSSPPVTVISRPMPATRASNQSTSQPSSSRSRPIGSGSGIGRPSSSMTTSPSTIPRKRQRSGIATVRSGRCSASSRITGGWPPGRLARTAHAARSGRSRLCTSAHASGPGACQYAAPSRASSGVSSAAKPGHVQVVGVDPDPQRELVPPHRLQPDRQQRDRVGVAVGEQRRGVGERLGQLVLRAVELGARVVGLALQVGVPGRRGGQLRVGGVAGADRVLQPAHHGFLIVRSGLREVGRGTGLFHP